MSYEEFLRTVDGFTSLSERSAHALAQQCRAVAFPAGERMIAKGASGDSMYIIQEGSVRVVVADDSGREKFIRRLGTGEFVGEMALLTGEPRSADVFVETDTRCLVIDKAPLQGFLSQNPSVAAFLTEILGHRLLESGQIRKVGKYQLLGEIGRGGVAIVYEGVHPVLQRTVAVKMLSHELVYDAEFSRRFRDEATIIARLEHPNIVRVYDCEEAYATYFIIMEKLEGTDLGRMRQIHGRFSEEKTRSILLQLASALDYAHRHGIIHRDIKPDNAVIDPDGRVKLMDFGIAKTRSDTAEEEDIIGTAEYMSPEQAMGTRMDGRADIYALGILVFEMLTGSLPFDDENPYNILRCHVSLPMPDLRTRAPEASPEMVAFVEKACRKDPEERFRDCQEIIAHFGGEERERPSLRGKTVTLLYDQAQEERVASALARLGEEIARAGQIGLVINELGDLELPSGRG